MPEAKIRIESGHNSDGLTMRIVDDVSGTALAAFTLDADQAWRVMGGGHETIDGQVSYHLDRVGKRMEHESVLMDQKYDYRHREAGLRDAESRAQALYPNWDSYSARLGNNARILVVMRRWV